MSSRLATAALILMVTICLFPEPAQAEVARVNFAPYQAYPVGSFPESVAIGDVTGDGRADALLSTSYYFDPANDFSLFVFPQLANGSLGSPTRLATDGQYGDSMGLDTGDLNGDGRTDVALAVTPGIDVYYQRRGGGLGAPTLFPTSSQAFAPVIADVNGDGKQDIVANTRGGVVVLSRGRGKRFVTQVVTTDPQWEVEVADVTGDGRKDIVGCSGLNDCSATVNVFEQRSNGSFQLLTYPGTNSSACGVGVGDVSGDGRADIVLSLCYNLPNARLDVFVQNASGALDPAVAVTSYDIPEPVEVADVNRDGAGDIVTLHGGWNEAGVFLKSGGTLQPENLYGIPYASHYAPKGMVVGDIDGNGSPDILAADYNNGLVVLRQT